MLPKGVQSGCRPNLNSYVMPCVAASAIASLLPLPGAIYFVLLGQFGLAIEAYCGRALTSQSKSASAVSP
jgi:hypothetical protein